MNCFHFWLVKIARSTTSYLTSSYNLTSSFSPVKCLAMSSTALPWKHIPQKLRLDTDDSDCFYFTYVFLSISFVILGKQFLNRLICKELCHIFFCSGLFGSSYWAMMNHDFVGVQRNELSDVMLGTYLLRWYCAYVLLSAMNGVTEGFKNATMSDSQVNR